MTYQKAKEMSTTISMTLLAHSNEPEYTAKQAQEDVLSILESYRIVKKNKLENYEVNGQLDITDYPEYLPENYEL